MSTSRSAHERTGVPIGHFMSTLCGAHKCSQRKLALMSTRVAHECSRKKTGFADACQGSLQISHVCDHAKPSSPHCKHDDLLWSAVPSVKRLDQCLASWFYTIHRLLFGLHSCLTLPVLALGCSTHYKTTTTKMLWGTQ